MENQQNKCMVENDWRSSKEKDVKGLFDRSYCGRGCAAAGDYRRHHLLSQEGRVG
jgi:hypothetical protein